jgi:hypothetical protein
MTMRTDLRILCVAGAVGVVTSLAGVVASQAQAQAPAARYTKDGKLEYPTDYRTWIFLSAGVDMAYSEAAKAMAAGGMHAFDNVFVDRAAYAAFQKTGTWPDGTVMMLEVRRGATKGSINQGGQFQTDRLGYEAHVKDSKRFKSGWAFFGFRGEEPGRELPQTSDCNVCHQDHAAVDTTFVQFYPTLLPVAKAKGTLSEKYLAEEKAAVK